MPPQESPELSVGFSERDENRLLTRLQVLSENTETLYAMALGAPRWLGAVTPAGGLAMMLGWLLLALHARG